ncbi:hypothetical protein [Lactococcus petauri]|uniref:hypothetical protein n=1 Tax=Lactococcus petauri TaxID=1940789 RepID=UPI001302C03D|nr:hypothetical protein [Lactococcus petauri]
MPTTKTGQIKSESHFHNAVKYILNPDKTNEQVLTSRVLECQPGDLLEYIEGQI